MLYRVSCQSHALWQENNQNWSVWDGSVRPIWEKYIASLRVHCTLITDTTLMLWWDASHISEGAAYSFLNTCCQPPQYEYPKHYPNQSKTDCIAVPLSTHFGNFTKNRFHFSDCHSLACISMVPLLAEATWNLKSWEIKQFHVILLILAICNNTFMGFNYPDKPQRQ